MKKKIIIIITCILAIFLVAINFNTIKNKAQQLIDSLNNQINDLESIIGTGSLISESDISSLSDSGIMGEEYTNNSTYYPYYDMLSSNQQTLYKQVYANAYELETTFIPTTDVTPSEVEDTITAVYNDHPELFWLNTSYNYKYTSSNKVVQISLSFNSTSSNITSSKEKFENSANKIISSASSLSSNYQKEKYVHDAIIDLASYDLNSDMNQSAYSALVKGKTVCAGYARAFQYIMIELGIPTYYVTGYSSGDHAWNIVYLSDGYYNVDLTWDDTNPTSYTYFNLTDSDFSSTHTRSGLSKGLPNCSGTSYRKSDYSSSKTTTNSSSNSKSNNSSKSNSNSSNNSNSKATNSNNKPNNSNKIDNGSNVPVNNTNDDTNNAEEVEDEAEE